MSATRLGSDYGGWWVDLDLIPDDSTVIDAGIGTDSSFSQELLQVKRVNVIAIDPTSDAKEYLKGSMPPRMVFLPFAVSTANRPVKMFVKPNGSHSMCKSMPGVTNQLYYVPGISLRSLIETNNVSLVKLDIEGTEFDVYRDCFGVRQVAIEFHVKQMPDYQPMFDKAIRDFKYMGYDVLHQTPSNEITFIK